MQAQTTSPYQIAAAHVQQSHPELAAPILTELLGRTPGDLKARNLLGIAYLNMGRREEAVKQFRLAVETDSKFYPAMKNLAIAELALGRRGEARGHFEEVLKIAPGDAVAHLNLGEMDFADGRYKEAVAHYDRSGGLYFKDPQGVLHMARAQMACGNAAAVIGMAPALEKSVEGLAVLAEAHEASGQTQRAYDALRSATQLEPANEEPYLQLMSLCVDHGTLDVALQVADASLAHTARPYRTRMQRGAVLALQGDSAGAEREFVEAVRIASDVTVTQVTLALVRIQSGRAAERVAMLRQARARHPKDYLVSWILGEALAQQSNAGDEAIRCLSDASRLAPGEAAPRVLLGKLLARRGDLAGAARELEAAVKIDGEDTQALYQLATVYRKAGNTKRADELFDRVAAKQGGPQAEPGLPKLEQVIRKSSR